MKLLYKNISSVFLVYGSNEALRSNLWVATR